jgi:hypothetical protein
VVGRTDSLRFRGLGRQLPYRAVEVVEASHCGGDAVASHRADEVASKPLGGVPSQRDSGAGSTRAAAAHRLSADAAASQLVPAVPVSQDVLEDSVSQRLPAELAEESQVPLDDPAEESQVPLDDPAEESQVPLDDPAEESQLVLDPLSGVDSQRGVGSHWPAEDCQLDVGCHCDGWLQESGCGASAVLAAVSQVDDVPDESHDGVVSDESQDGVGSGEPMNASQRSWGTSAAAGAASPPPAWFQRGSRGPSPRLDSCPNR